MAPYNIGRPLKKSKVVDGRCPDMSADDILKATQQVYGAVADWVYYMEVHTLAPPGEYEWTVLMRRDGALCQITLTTCYYY